MVSRAIALTGTDSLDPPMRQLSAGPLSAEFDNGALRYVRFGGIEVLRAIAFLVRDENWGTFNAVIDKLEIAEKDDGFSVSYRGVCADAVRELVYNATISGNTDGSLSFEVVATPETDFLTNRAGFIVLHPLDGVVGHPVRIKQVDGSECEAHFPETISPACPFKNLRAISHQVAPGTWATCTMEGDTFEMEDQRNWSDASYKTYVRPLTEPRPYVLPRGEPVTQAVRLAFDGVRPARGTGGAASAVTVQIGGEAGPMPAIGIGVPASEAAPALLRADLVKRLGPQWLVCNIDLRLGHGLHEMMDFHALAKVTGANVALEIITLGSLDPDSELAAVAAAAREAGLKPSAISAFAAQDMSSYQPGEARPVMATFEQTFAAARKAFPQAKIGGGMAAYFTELNRKRPPAGPLDYVTHTTCPGVHAADDRSVMETLETLPYQIESTRAFMGRDLGYRIGPSQLGCRENPYGRATTPNPDNQRLCLSVIDPRQRGLFNAAWSLGYAAACASGGLEVVALGAPTGAFGHIHRRTDFVQPHFDDLNGPAVYPSFHVLAGLARLAGGTRLSVELSHAGKVAALAVVVDGQTHLWIANLTAGKITATWRGNDGVKARVSVLDADGFERLTVEPDYLDAAARETASASVDLDAYATARFVTDQPRGR